MYPPMRVPSWLLQSMPARVAAGLIVALPAALGLYLAAPAAGDPGGAAVRCDVYGDPSFGPPGMGGFGIGLKRWQGTVIGRGADLAQAQADAERQKWGPYGRSPELRNCAPVA